MNVYQYTAVKYSFAAIIAKQLGKQNIPCSHKQLTHFFFPSSMWSLMVTLKKECKPKQLRLYPLQYLGKLMQGWSSDWNFFYLQPLFSSHQPVTTLEKVPSPEAKVSADITYFASELFRGSVTEHRSHRWTHSEVWATHQHKRVGEFQVLVDKRYDSCETAGQNLLLLWYNCCGKSHGSWALLWQQWTDPKHHV